MKNSLFSAPSLGSIQATGYWLALPVLLFGGVLFFLHFIFLVTMAVPVVGAFHRSPKLPWRLFSVGSVTLASGYLVFEYLRLGSRGLVFYSASDTYGFTFPQINFHSFLVVSLVLLPLSAFCAIDRVCSLREQDFG